MLNEKEWLYIELLIAQLKYALSTNNKKLYNKYYKIFFKPGITYLKDIPNYRTIEEAYKTVDLLIDFKKHIDPSNKVITLLLPIRADKILKIIKKERKLYKKMYGYSSRYQP